MKLRNRVRDFLIRLANDIGDKTYYDFGEPIVNGFTFKKKLIVFTKSGIYALGKGKTWTKVSRKIGVSK